MIFNDCHVFVFMAIQRDFMGVRRVRGFINVYYLYLHFWNLWGGPTPPNQFDVFGQPEGKQLLAPQVDGHW